MNVGNEKCEHKNLIWVWRTISGNKIYGTQCLMCGRWAAVKQDKIPLRDKASCGEYDDSVRQQYDKKICEQRKIAYEEQAETNRNTQLSEYYKSSHWQFIRDKRLSFNRDYFNGRCEICFTNRATHVHHITYARMGREWIFDLAAICEECHAEEHPHMVKHG